MRVICGILILTLGVGAIASGTPSLPHKTTPHLARSPKSASYSKRFLSQAELRAKRLLENPSLVRAVTFREGYSWVARCAGDTSITEKNPVKIARVLTSMQHKSPVNTQVSGKAHMVPPHRVEYTIWPFKGDPITVQYVKTEISPRGDFHPHHVPMLMSL